MRWLVYSSYGGEGATTKALSGGDVKQAIYLPNLLQQLKPILFLPGDLSCWIEPYLEMVNLLLIVIKFQRTGN